MKIQFKVQVHTDRPIEKPLPFMRGVFESFVPCWHLVDIDGPTMTAESIVFDVDEKTWSPVKLFDSITPEMFESNMTRTWNRIK